MANGGTAQAVPISGRRSRSGGKLPNSLKQSPPRHVPLRHWRRSWVASVRPATCHGSSSRWPLGCLLRLTTRSVLVLPPKKGMAAEAPQSRAGSSATRRSTSVSPGSAPNPHGGGYSAEGVGVLVAGGRVLDDIHVRSYCRGRRSRTWSARRSDTRVTPRSASVDATS
jgi:hypothetical protein